MVEQAQLEMTQAMIEREQLKEELINMRKRMEEHVDEMTRRMQEERELVRLETKTEREELGGKVCVDSLYIELKIMEEVIYV